MQVRGFERYIFLSILLILFLSPDNCFNKLSIFPSTFQESHQNIKPVLIQSRRNILSGPNDLQSDNASRCRVLTICNGYCIS